MKYKTLIGIIVALIILAVLLWKLDLNEISIAFKNINYFAYFIIFSVNFIVISFLFTHKWWLILKYMGSKIKYKDAFLIMIGTMPLHIILPLKSADLIKSLYLRKYGLNFKKAVSSSVYDNAIDGLIVAFLVIIGFFYFPYSPLHNEKIIYTITIAIFILFALLYFLGKKEKRTDFLYAFKSITIKKSLFLILYTLLAYLIMFTFRYLIFIILDIKVPWFEAVVLSALTVLITLIPVSISGLGVRESATIFLFSQYGTAEQLFTAGILISLIYLGGAFLCLFFTKKIIREFPINKIR